MTRKPQQMISDWYAAIELNRKAYLASSRSLDKFHYTIGLAVFLLCVGGGTMLVVVLPTPLLRFLAGFVSLTAAVLTVIQTFYSHAKLSAAHRAAASQLDELRREIQELEKLPPRYLENQTEILLQVDQRLEKIEKTAPPLDRDLVTRLRDSGDSRDHLLNKIKESA